MNDYMESTVPSRVSDLQSPCVYPPLRSSIRAWVRYVFRISFSLVVDVDDVIFLILDVVNNFELFYSYFSSFEEVVKPS